MQIHVHSELDYIKITQEKKNDKIIKNLGNSSEYLLPRKLSITSILNFNKYLIVKIELYDVWLVCGFLSLVT